MQAEVVTDRPMTAEQLLALPDDGQRHELVRGELRTMAPAGYGHGRVAGNVLRSLATFVRQHGLGDVLAAETGFRLERDPDTVRAPDAAFVAADRVPPPEQSRGFPDLVPDLVAEVVSPTDRSSEVTEKALVWLDAGARAVWVVDPSQRLVVDYRTGGVVHLVREPAELDGGDVLPGFRLPLSELFD